MLDLDGFKQVNDERGHAADDGVLREAARRMCAHIRPCDVLARIDGDEFLLVAPECGVAAIEHLAERLRGCIADTDIETAGCRVHVTMSIKATVTPTGDLTAEALMARADKGLYESKLAGRNRVTVLSADETPSPA